MNTPTAHSTHHETRSVSFLRAADAYDSLRTTILFHSDGVGLCSEFDKALGLMDEELGIDHTLPRGRWDPGRREKYVKDLDELMTSTDKPSIRAIRKILIQAGIAFPLWYGDWDVDRPNESYGSKMGIIPPDEILRLYADSAKGILGDQAPKSLYVMNSGAGNGASMIDFRENWSAKSGNTEQINVVGIADKIYFPLSRLMQNFWKGDISVGEEVCRFLMTQIQYMVQSWRRSHPEKLHPLQDDLTLLPSFLMSHAGIFAHKIRRGAYKADNEFADRSKRILLSDRAREAISLFLRNPKGFLDTHMPGFEGDEILMRAPVFMQNIHIGDFSQMDQKFPGVDRFHLITSLRGSSHLDDEAYEALLHTSVEKLAPGFPLIDDGIKRSYTREIRLREVIHVLERAGRRVRAYLVKNKRGKILSVIFEKGIEVGGEIKFPDETIHQKLTLPGSTLVPIERGVSVGAEEQDHRNSIDIEESIRSRVMMHLFRDIREQNQDKFVYWNILQRLHTIHERIDEILATLPENIELEKSVDQVLARVSPEFDIIKQVHTK